MNPRSAPDRTGERPCWPGGARCAVTFGIHVDGPSPDLFDAPEVWDKPVAFSVPSYGLVRGVPRILEWLRSRELRASFFVPGWTAEWWPERFTEIVEAGHEIANHGYLHEPSYAVPADQRRALLERSQEVFERLAGRRALGYRSPGGDLGAGVPELLLELGFTYNSGMSADDRPYRWEINGAPSELIELPVHWELDDFLYWGYHDDPPMPASLDRIADNAGVFDNWRREFDGYRRFGGCFNLMMHPDISGKPGRLRALDQLLDHMTAQSDVWFATAVEIADWWRSEC